MFSFHIPGCTFIKSHLNDYNSIVSDIAQHLDNLCNLKYKRKKFNYGVDFGTTELEENRKYCTVITNNMNVNRIFIETFNNIGSLWLEATNDPNQIQIRDTPPKFENGIKSIINELK